MLHDFSERFSQPIPLSFVSDGRDKALLVLWVLSGIGRWGDVAAGLWLWFAVLVSFMLSMSNCRACGVEK